MSLAMVVERVTLDVGDRGVIVDRDKVVVCVEVVQC